MARAVKGKGRPTAVEISAARDILDRAGLTAKEAEGATGTTIQLVVMRAGQSIDQPGAKMVDIRSLIKRD